MDPSREDLLNRPGELPIKKIVTGLKHRSGVVFDVTAPLSEFSLGRGVLFGYEGNEFLVVPWGEKDSELWVFMRNADGTGNPDWRSYRKVGDDEIRDPYYLEMIEEADRRSRVYLAARYSRREELCNVREELSKLGYSITSRWLNGDHQISDEEMSDEARRAAKAHFAAEDWEDLRRAAITVSFTEEPRSCNSRGGRHVEFGAALAMGQRCIVVGPAENVFHLLPGVEIFGELSEALLTLAGK